jgi:hypothetical protein
MKNLSIKISLLFILKWKSINKIRRQTMVTNRTKKTVVVLLVILFLAFGTAMIVMGDNQIQASSAQSATSSVANGVIVTDNSNANNLQSVVGTWDFYFEWYTLGKSYTHKHIIFYNNGTFLIPEEKSTGNWKQDRGMILWDYDTSKTVYCGNVDKKEMNGIMDNFLAPSTTGCWYATKKSQ